jgi:peptide/nickel transport system permease protein
MRLRLLAEIEDEVLRNHWVTPLYDASAVYGYSDRVLAHPIHGLKNAAISVFTLFAVNFAHLISGAVVTETFFARDYAVVQTVVFFAALVIVVVNLLVDLTYAWLDPRIRVAR